MVDKLCNQVLCKPNVIRFRVNLNIIFVGFGDDSTSVISPLSCSSRCPSLFRQLGSHVLGILVKY